MIPEGYNLVADIAVGGAKWYQCAGCRDGSIFHVPSASWECTLCGAIELFGCHVCPTVHNHPIVSDNHSGRNISLGIW